MRSIAQFNRDARNERSEFNRSTHPPNVTEDTFDIIYRRSLVINLHSGFAHPTEYNLLRNDGAGNLGISARGDALRDFNASARRARFFFPYFDGF